MQCINPHTTDKILLLRFLYLPLFASHFTRLAVAGGVTNCLFAPEMAGVLR